MRGWFHFILFKIGLRGEKLQTESLSLDAPKFDVESIRNYPNVFVDGESVIVTEKIHGSQARYVFYDGHMYAGSRNFWKSPNSNCIWRKTLKTHPWIEKWCQEHEGWTLYGEVTPTQKGFNYGSNEPQFFVFDVRDLNGERYSVPPTDFWAGHWVPILYIGAYSDDLKEFANGPSTVTQAKNIREGCVIRSTVDRHVRGIGRLLLKCVSNAFLEKDNK